MAFGIMGVVIFHSGIGTKFGIINDLISWGEVGVDMLLLASGLGCYYSFNKDGDYIGFLKRRVLKVMPVYWILLAVFWYKQFLPLPEKIPTIFSSFFCVGSFGGQGWSVNWFMGALWWMYILVPLFSGLVNRSKKWFHPVLVLLAVLAFTAAFWDVPNPHIMALTRFPIFILGMYLGKAAKEGKKLKAWHMIVIFSVMVIGVVWLKFDRMHRVSFYKNMASVWWPFELIAPGICLLLSLMANAIEKSKFGRGILWVLGAIGAHTFIIFMYHIHLMDHCRERVNNVERLLWILNIILGSIVLVYIEKGIRFLIGLIAKKVKK